MIFTNARCVFGDGVRDGLELVVRDGKISDIREPAASRPTADSVDLGGNYLAPGFVDLHVHGAAGHDTMEASESAFRAICDYHASGGTTSLLLTTATAPVDAIIDVLNAVRACASFRQVAGVHIEGPFISKLKPGAHGRNSFGIRIAGSSNNCWDMLT
jgi:N-acetylglucosamine-6-phosphate deacetylase